jgi:SAM-dependent methyltransferase
MSDTLSIYDKDAKAFAEGFEGQRPERLYDLLRTFFVPTGAVLDVGCGSGRDVEHMRGAGYDAVGIDASDGMIEEARRLHPNCNFLLGGLPDLRPVPDDNFDYVWCCAVIMHLPEEQLVSSLVSLLRVCRTEGKVLVTFRGPSRPERDQGRLFTNFSVQQIAELFESLGAMVLHSESVSESELTWHTVIVKKQSITSKEGIARIQDVITNDNKTATYKLTLLRALCHIARSENHSVFWDPGLDHVVVPLQRIALCWIRYYWKVLGEGLKQTTKGDLQFAKNLRAVKEVFSHPLDVIENFDSGSPHPKVLALVREIAQTIDKNPVRYTGGSSSPVFGGGFKKVDLSGRDDLDKWFSIGKDNVPVAMKVPAKIWRDLRLFHHWIEKSLLVEWFQLTKELNPKRSDLDLLPLIFESDFEESRKVKLAQVALKSEKIVCCWTGKPLSKFDLDHVIAYSLWKNNDLWNLLPASPAVNLKKSQKLPHPRLIEARADTIQRYWAIYSQAYPQLFENQFQRAHGGQHSLAPNRVQLLINTVSQVHYSRGVEYFKP